MLSLWVYCYQHCDWIYKNPSDKIKHSCFPTHVTTLNYFFVVWVFCLFVFVFHNFIYYYFYFSILYWFCHISTWIHTGVLLFPMLNPSPTSLPIPSLWGIPVHQPWASCIMHQTWSGDLFHIWYYTYFNAILPSHPTLSLSHRVQKTVLYICVSFAVLYTGLSLPPF